MNNLQRSGRVARLGVGGLLVAGALTTLSACGSSGSSELKVTETQPAANKYAFEGVKSVKGGTVKVSLDNKGKVPHAVQLVRVDGTHSQTEVLDALKKSFFGQNQPLVDYLHPAGGVSAVKPGQTVTASVVVPPGQYYVIDTNTGQANNAPPYFTQGAVKALQVKGGKASGSLPSAQQTVTIKDAPGDKFEFANPSSLKAGKTTLELDNQSKKEFHHVQIVPLLPGKTLADAKKALASQSQGPPPVDLAALQGTAVIEHNSKLVADVNLKPGNYIMLCFLQDRNGKGGPHFGKGLLKEVKVS